MTEFVDGVPLTAQELNDAFAGKADVGTGSGVEGDFLPTTGGTITGTLTINSIADVGQVNCNVPLYLKGDPAWATEAATMRYVDNAVGNAINLIQALEARIAALENP